RRSEDEDDRPSKKKKGGGSMMLILGGGLAVVAVVAIIVAAVMFSGGDDSSSNPTNNAGGAPAADPATTKNDTPATPVKQEPVSVLTNITNLLPNSTQAVVSYPMDYTYGSAVRSAALVTDQSDAGFNPHLFQSRFGYGVDEVNRIVTALSIKDNWV